MHSFSMERLQVQREEDLLKSTAKALLKRLPARMVIEELKRIGIDETKAKRITNTQRRFHAILGGQR